MAIHASVKYRSLKAGVTHRSLQLSASIQKTAAVVLQQNVVASLSSRRLDASFNIAKLTAVSNWQKLFLHNIHVNADRTIYVLNDEFLFSDDAIFAVDKGLSDAIGFLSVDPVFTVGKQLEDSAVLVDSARFHAGKGTQDSLLFADNQAFDIDSLRLDQFSFAEDVHTLLTFLRDFDSSTSITDGVTASVSKPQSDSYGFADTVTASAVKGVSDALAFTDDKTFDVSVLQQDSIFHLDSLVVTRQPFNFVFTEVSGVSSVTGEPDDSFGFSDGVSFSGSISLQDYFALDDFSQVDKDVLGVKSNVIGFADDLASSVDKNIPNQSFSLTEQHLFALSKPAADSIISTDILTSHASKSVTDTTTLNDAATLSPRIGKSDSTPIVDSLDVEHVITGALLNQALIGNLILNAD